MNLVGYHVGGLKELAGIALSEPSGVWQAFNGNPKSLWTTYDKAPDFQLKDEQIGIIHAPLTVCPGYSPSEHIWRASLRLALNTAKYMTQIGAKYYVTHVGGYQSGLSFNSGMNSLKVFCEKWIIEQQFQNTNCVLCLENDAGGGRRLGKVNALHGLVQKINSPLVRLCFDTEHAVAEGFDIRDEILVDSILPSVELIHLNSIPQSIYLGCRRDNHRTTIIQDSNPHFLSSIVRIAKLAVDNQIPCVLERDTNLVPQDLEYLRSNLCQ